MCHEIGYFSLCFFMLLFSPTPTPPHPTPTHLIPVDLGDVGAKPADATITLNIGV